MGDFRATSDPITQLSNLDNGLQHQLGWKDNLAFFSSSKGNGVTEPVWSAMGNGNYGMLFTAGDQLFVTHHVGHDYALGTKAYPHIHFCVTQTQTVGATVVWRYSYVVAKGHQQGDSLTAARTTIDLTYTFSGSEVAGEHIIVEASEVQAFEILEPDTLVDAGVELLSETVVGNVFGKLSDLHYQANREDTPNKTPSFYV